MDNNLPTSKDQQDQVDIELQKARLKAKQQRRDAIGQLLDQATDVLSDVLNDSNSSKREKIEAASLAVNLYVQQENGERQDAALEIQKKRLELEEKKLSMPGGPLFNQTNVYLPGQQPTTDPQLLEIERQALLARKQAQDALLSSYLPPKKEQQ